MNGDERYHTLNLPPHHMGLWDKASLHAVAELFNLRVIATQYDTLLYTDSFTDAFIRKNIGFSKSIAALMRPFLRLYFHMTRKFRLGQGISVIYEKKA